MSNATVWLEKRPEKWVLAIEPWAQALDVNPDERVRLSLPEAKEKLGLDIWIENDIVTIAIEDRRFSIRVGDVDHDFDFGDGPALDLFSGYPYHLA